MKYYRALILLTLLMMSTFASGQDSTVSVEQDSTNLSLSELKQTLGLLTELEYRRVKNVQSMDKENIYKSIIKDYQSAEELFRKEIANFEEALKESKPAWYNNFWTGAAVTAIISFTVILLAR